MVEYNPHKPLISLHMPKTGGTSLRFILNKWYGKSFYYHSRKFMLSSKKEKINLFHDPWKFFPKKKLCIHGHFNRIFKENVELIYPEVEQFISILRDPLDKAVSVYFYARKRIKQNKNAPRDMEYVMDMALNDFIKTYGCGNFAGFFARPVTLDNYREVIEKYYVYIGIMEDFQTSVDILAAKLGFETMPVPHKNKSPRDEELTQDSIDAFMERNRFDYEIYNYVKENYLRW
ncbi:MAG: sulfotransferase family 2 domain-containing protein [Bacteroidota bacterium]